MSILKTKLPTSLLLWVGIGIWLFLSITNSIIPGLAMILLLPIGVAISLIGAIITLREGHWFIGILSIFTFFAYIILVLVLATL